MVAPKDAATTPNDGMNGMNEDVEGEVDMEVEVRMRWIMRTCCGMYQGRVSLYLLRNGLSMSGDPAILTLRICP